MHLYHWPATTSAPQEKTWGTCVTRLAKDDYFTCYDFPWSEKWRNHNPHLELRLVYFKDDHWTQRGTDSAKSFSLALPQTWYTQWRYLRDCTQKQAYLSFVCKLGKRIKTSVELGKMVELHGLRNYQCLWVYIHSVNWIIEYFTIKFHN